MYTEKKRQRNHFNFINHPLLNNSRQLQMQGSSADNVCNGIIVGNWLTASVYIGEVNVCTNLHEEHITSIITATMNREGLFLQSSTWYRF